MGDTGSVHSYRLAGHTGQTSASASGSVKSGYAPATEVDGDELQQGMTTGRSSSPVSNMSLSGDEVTLPSTSGGSGNNHLVALRRSARRARVVNSSSQQHQQHQQAAGDSDFDHGSQVRFDEHVNYIDRRSATKTSSASTDQSEDDQSEST